MIDDDFTWIPPVDIYELDNNYIVNAEIPGVERRDIKLEFSGMQLTIRGERHHDPLCTKESYHRLEGHRGKFCRTFTLPEPVNRNCVHMELKDGILHLVLPKIEGAKNSSVRGSR
jgi:HSP20 family protein